MTIDIHRADQPRRANPSGRSGQVEVLRCRDGEAVRQADAVAVEEPLEIRLGWEMAGKPAQKSISVTMRTPGRDAELAAGFLFGEGMIDGGGDIEGVECCDGDGQRVGDGDSRASNIVRVHVGPEVEVDLGSLERHFYTTSSCGVCGKASLEALEMQDCPTLAPSDEAMAAVPAELVCALPDRLREAQSVFEDTGGLHAAGLFAPDGELLEVREDVGRHNAMDKLVGARLLDEQLPLDGTIVVLSGRASFELLQKALMARAPVVVAVGAPSSLAVDVAEEFGVTLVGFARDGRCNVYTHPGRLAV